MKKTFLYVMMAAAALFTCTMTSCNDDDDVKKNNEQTEVMIDDINQSIMNNFVVLGDDNTPVRGGLHGGFKDAADATSFICQVADAEAAVKFYNALMPDSLVSKVKVDGEKRTLSYTQEGKQYTMTYAPATGENIAIITLPNVEGYNKYARTVQLRDHVSDNSSIAPAAFIEKYPLGQTFKVNGGRLIVTDMNGNDPCAYTTIAKDGYSPDYYCMYNNGHIALFVYFADILTLNHVREDYLVWYESKQDDDDDLYDGIDNEALVKRQVHGVNEKVYPVSRANTNVCYLKSKEGGINEYLPTMQEVEAVFNNFGAFVQGYNKIHGTQYPTTRLSSRDKLEIIQKLAPGYTEEDVNFATCETKNSLFSTKKVQAYDVFYGSNWEDKNSKNILSVMYIRIKLNK